MAWIARALASTARKAYLDIHMRPERRNAFDAAMIEEPELV